MSTFSQNICGVCGHGIHAHADYILTIVNHYPTNQCAAYVQRVCLLSSPHRISRSQLRSLQTILTQRCTCEAQFCEHITTNNWYRLPEPWTVLDYFNPASNDPSPSAAMSYFDNANSPFSLNPMSSDYNTAILSGDGRNVSLTPSAPSPSATSTSSAIQPNTAPTLGFSSNGYFQNYFVNSPYAGPPEGGATNESFEYQDYRNATYAEPPEAEGSSGSYGA